jgi:hypothetical protein
MTRFIIVGVNVAIVVSSGNPPWWETDARKHD